jgi:hypothetical protein
MQRGRFNTTGDTFGENGGWHHDDPYIHPANGDADACPAHTHGRSADGNADPYAANPRADV